MVVIAGPTAAGKTAAGIRLARAAGAEILSADSVQVYRGLDVGSAKPSLEERRQVPHHMIDVAAPDETMSAASFADMARARARDVLNRGRRLLVVGGTGLYIRALVEGLIQVPEADRSVRRKLREYERIQGPGSLHQRLAEVDPRTAHRLHPSDLVRIIRALEVWELTGIPISEHQARQVHAPFFEARYVGLDPGKEALSQRIEARVQDMFAHGLIEETQALLAEGYDPLLKSLQSPGYKQTIAFLQHKISLELAMEQTIRAHRRYARRQRVWFRSIETMTWYQTSEDIPYDALCAWLEETGPNQDAFDKPRSP